MKKLIGLMAALILVLSLCACGGQPAAEQKAESGAATETDTKEVTDAASESADVNSDGVTQADIEKNIIGRWMLSEEDGTPVVTNEKSVFNIVATNKAYAGVSRVSNTGQISLWHSPEEVEITVNDNVVTITINPGENRVFVHEFTINDISDSEFTANYKRMATVNGSESSVTESVVSFVKVDDDYSENILGIWEGHCTSEGSVFDDGQDHRWEYKDDGTYVYYVKDGDSWVPSDNEQNEYFVDGNLLCTRWVEGGTEYREWWEISIDGDKMNWTALREDEDGKTFTATFEMKRVEDASGEVTQADIEKNIVGTWILTEKDGQPALTNEKRVYDIVSTTEALVDSSRVIEKSDRYIWHDGDEADVSIKDNVMTITGKNGSSTHEFTISEINGNKFTANRKLTVTEEGSDPIVRESVVTYTKTNDDFSKDILGTWEGRCTSEGSVFDDGQDHRWEFKNDGTYVYYVKNGDSWVPSEDTMNEYFVAGNLLCSRWMENGQENREWWELSIDGDKMNWTALREGEDGKTFTATFEMTKVKE